MREKQHYWQEPDWDCLSPRRKYTWRLTDRSDWQDVLSTYDCLQGEAGSPDTAKPKPAADQGG